MFFKGQGIPFLGEQPSKSTESVGNGHESYSEINLHKATVTTLLCQVIIINCVLFHLMRERSYNIKR